MRCTVLLRDRSPRIAQGLTYDAGRQQVKPGCLVQVPLRRKMTEGIVLDVLHRSPAKDPFAVRPLSAVLSNIPLVPSSQLRTLYWMAKTYYCSLRECLEFFLRLPWGAMLPLATI